MVDGRVGVSDSGSDPPPATPSAGHAPTRLTPPRDLHGSSGIQCWTARPRTLARRSSELSVNDLSTLSGGWRTFLGGQVGQDRTPRPTPVVCSRGPSHGLELSSDLSAPDHLRQDSVVL
jgi:hypothetical protein